MIKSIALKNFRGFREHSVEFTPFCLLIGQNNAGKSTLVEALRIASAALGKANTATFTMAPDSIGPDVTGPVYRFSLETLDLQQRGIHYNYDTTDPALIKVNYKNNCSVLVALGPTASEAFCQLSHPAGKRINSRSQVKSTRFHSIFVMPPVGALLAEETVRENKYLYKHINGYLSYRHIRNQMFNMPAEFKKFKGLLVDTWPNLQIAEIEEGLGEGRNQFGLTIRDGPFVSEMALVGSGLQAWIQTLWFLSRVDSDSTVVLDEPDVYLHADLQRKLVKLLSAEHYRQTVVATHSLEMIADVSSSEIISVKKRSTRSRPLSSDSQAQALADGLGTNLNLQLSKVASAGMILFVEGKDYAFLDQIAYKRGNVFYDKFSKVPHFSVGGLNNWRRAALTAKAFFETSGGKVGSTMILDRDYEPSEFFDKILKEARVDHLFVKVWRRKEIENYFVNPDLITSYISNRACVDISYDDVLGLMTEVVSKLSETLPEMIADGYQAADRKLALPTTMKKAKDYIKAELDSGARYEDLIGGRQVLSEVSRRSQELWGVQLGAMSLCRHMKLSDAPAELREVVIALAD